MILQQPYLDSFDLHTYTSKFGSTVYPPFYRPHSGSFKIGESFIRLMDVQKGDGIHATPWKWRKHEYDAIPTFLTIKRILPPDRYGNSGSWTFVRNMMPQMVKNNGGSFPVMSQDAMHRVRSMSVLKAQASLNKQVASLPLLFAERKASLKTVKKYSKFIMNNAITMQRKDVKKWLAALKRKSRPEQLKKLARDIANSHLEFVFGVLPIIDEIESSLEHFTKPRVDVRTGRGRQRLVLEDDRRFSFNESETTVRGTVTSVTDFSVRTNLRCAITDHIKNDASLLGFNPVYSLYDLTVLSFVVGWFSNFNTWIQSLDPLIGLEYVTGSSSEMTITEHTSTIDGASKPNYPPYVYEKPQVDQGWYRDRVTNFERVVHGSMPDIQDLQFMNKNSLFTATASLSLMIQRFVKESNQLSSRKAFKYRGPRIRNLPKIKYRKV